MMCVLPGSDDPAGLAQQLVGGAAEAGVATRIFPRALAVQPASGGLLGGPLRRRYDDRLQPRPQRGLERAEPLGGLLSRLPREAARLAQVQGPHEVAGPGEVLPPGEHLAAEQRAVPGGLLDLGHRTGCTRRPRRCGGRSGRRPGPPAAWPARGHGCGSCSSTPTRVACTACARRRSSTDSSVSHEPQLGDLVVGKHAVGDLALVDDEPIDLAEAVLGQHPDEVLGDHLAGLGRHPGEHDGQPCSALLGQAEQPPGRCVGVTGRGGDEDPQVGRVEHAVSDLVVLLDDRVDVRGVEQCHARREAFCGDEHEAAGSRVGVGLALAPQAAEQVSLGEPLVVVGVAGEDRGARGGAAHAGGADLGVGQGVDERGLARAGRARDDDERRGGAHVDAGNHVVVELGQDLALGPPGLLGAREVQVEAEVGDAVAQGGERVGQGFGDDVRQRDLPHPVALRLLGLLLFALGRAVGLVVDPVAVLGLGLKPESASEPESEPKSAVSAGAEVNLRGRAGFGAGIDLDLGVGAGVEVEIKARTGFGVDLGVEAGTRVRAGFGVGLRVEDDDVVRLCVRIRGVQVDALGARPGVCLG